MNSNKISNDKLILSALDTLNAVQGVWNQNIRERVEMTVACPDANHIPRVKNAGELISMDGVEAQVMHNGVLVAKAGYQGTWQVEIATRLKGLHEPQEEKVFYEVLKRIGPDSIIIELGAWWAYYSLWFLKEIAASKAICCEPDIDNLLIGQLNAELNNFEINKDVFFINAASGDLDKEKIEFTNGKGQIINTQVRTVDSIANEFDLKSIDILHLDIQGSELKALEGARKVIQDGLVRFIFISTHHYAISGDPNIHNKCLEFIKELHGIIIAKHTILESSSGDGLIVASFSSKDKDFKVDISLNHTDEALFRSAEKDIEILWNRYDELILELNDNKQKYENELTELNKQLVLKKSKFALLNKKKKS